MLGAIMDGPIKYPAHGKVNKERNSSSGMGILLLNWVFFGWVLVGSGFEITRRCYDWSI